MVAACSNERPLSVCMCVCVCQWVSETSPRDWVRAGEFAMWPRCVRVRVHTTTLVHVRVRALMAGAVRGAVRLAAPAGTARMLHLHSYAIHFNPKHITIEVPILYTVYFNSLLLRGVFYLNTHIKSV